MEVGGDMPIERGGGGCIPATGRLERASLAQLPFPAPEAQGDRPILYVWWAHPIKSGGPILNV